VGHANLFERATMTLPPASLARVLAAVDANRLMELHRGYYGGAADGTQWVLWIRQGRDEKSVYLDNYFPAPIGRFARELDAALAQSGLAGVTWEAVPEAETRRHEVELWASIER
jgi:hypothetical protein